MKYYISKEIFCPYCKLKIIIPMREDRPLNLHRICERCNKEYIVKNDKALPIHLPDELLNPSRRNSYEKKNKNNF